MNYEGLQNQRQNIRKDFSGKKTFSTISLLIARLSHHRIAFDFDTDWNQMLMNCQLKISKACSGSGSVLKSIPALFLSTRKDQLGILESASVFQFETIGLVIVSCA